MHVVQKHTPLSLPPSLPPSLTGCSFNSPSHTTSQASPKTLNLSSSYRNVNRCALGAVGGIPSSSSTSLSAFSAYVSPAWKEGGRESMGGEVRGKEGRDRLMRTDISKAQGNAHLCHRLKASALPPTHLSFTNPHHAPRHHFVVARAVVLDHRPLLHVKLPLAVLGEDVGGPVKETLFPLRAKKGRKGGKKGGVMRGWEGPKEKLTRKTYHDCPPLLPQDLVVLIDYVDLS